MVLLDFQRSVLSSNLIRRGKARNLAVVCEAGSDEHVREQ